MHSWEEVDRELRRRIKGLPVMTRKFLRAELPILVSDIQEKFYTTGGQGIGVRSGHARRSWDFEVGYPRASVFNTSPYADHSKPKTITPKRAKFLAIPMAAALTASKVPRFSGPRDPVLSGRLQVIRTGEGKLFLIEQGKGPRSKPKFFFQLVKKVTIPARTGGLKPYVLNQARTLVDHYAQNLGKLMDRGT